MVNMRLLLECAFLAVAHSVPTEEEEAMLLQHRGHQSLVEGGTFTRSSKINFYNYDSGNLKVCVGTSDYDCINGLWNVNDASVDFSRTRDDGVQSLFQIWDIPDVSEATSTTLFDSNGKMIRQNIVFNKAVDDMSLVYLAPEYQVATKTEVKQKWETYMKAFQRRDTESMVKLYDSDATITFYNTFNREHFEYRQNSKKRRLEVYYDSLFNSLWDTSDMLAPITLVEEDFGNHKQIFLVWQAVKSGFDRVTETIIINEHNKIVTHNVVVYYSPVFSGWKNHFGAFGSKNIRRMFLDYTDDSVITVYNPTNDQTQVFSGLQGVEKCFDIWFTNLNDVSDIAAPVEIINEAREPKEPGSVFLIWEVPASRYNRGTDTFIFNGNKIIYQYVVLARDVDYEEFETQELAPNDCDQNCVLDPFWKRFKIRFQEEPRRAVSFIRNQLYSDNTVIHFYNFQARKQMEIDLAKDKEDACANDPLYPGSEVTGARDIRGFWEQWLQGVEGQGLTIMLEKVVEPTDSFPGHIFFTWSGGESTYDQKYMGTQTLIFNMDNKIVRHTIVDDTGLWYL